MIINQEGRNLNSQGTIPQHVSGVSQADPRMLARMNRESGLSGK